METIQDYVMAAEEYLARKERSAHPDGSFDRASRWYPSDDEWQDCCAGIREPSRAWPYSLMVHCRTLVHVANLYDVDEADLRNVVAELRRTAS